MKGFVDKIIRAIQDFTAQFINALVDKLHLRDAYEKNHTLFIGVLALLLVIILFSTVLMLARPKDKNTGTAVTINPDITQPFVLPEVPSMNEDYYLSRPKNEVWDEEEAEKWFTIPDNAMMQQLEHDNNRLINNLLEASP